MRELPLNCEKCRFSIPGVLVKTFGCGIDKVVLSSIRKNLIMDESSYKCPSFCALRQMNDEELEVLLSDDDEEEEEE